MKLGFLAKMFGYLAHKLTVDSTFWNYLSVQVYQEIGGNVHITRGKVFDEKVIKKLMDITIGTPVRFEVKLIQRKTRIYTNIVDIEAIHFDTCEKCCKPLEDNHDCVTNESERLEGVFDVLDVKEEDYGQRFVLKQNDVIVTYLMWDSLPFYDNHYKVGDKVNIIGWRTPTRITNLRKFSKV